MKLLPFRIFHSSLFLNFIEKVRAKYFLGWFKIKKIHNTKVIGKRFFKLYQIQICWRFRKTMTNQHFPMELARTFSRYLHQRFQIWKNERSNTVLEPDFGSFLILLCDTHSIIFATANFSSDQSLSIFLVFYLWCVLFCLASIFVGFKTL